MTNNHDYLGTSDTASRLRADVLVLMLKGAGYAAAFCVAFGFFIWIWYAIGLLLPPESKEAQDPNLSYYDLLVETEQTV
ncbi:MAG: RC-LH1 core complex protein PufX [Pseudomonadota bacterium]